MAPPPFPGLARCDSRVPTGSAGAEDPPMSVVPMISPEGASATVRCACGRCGAHVVVRRSWQLSGMCGNCRSYDLRPLGPGPAPPAPGPSVANGPVPARIDAPRIPWVDCPAA
jgi:hypothetical protein